jgi:ATP-dependent Clp protease adaptor protein ClpS
VDSWLTALGAGATAAAALGLVVRRFRHLLRALLRSGPEGVRGVFEQHGLTAERWPPLASATPAATRATATSRAADAGPYRSQAPLDTDVVFWNDKKTTQEFVTELLRDTFGVAEPHASRLMLSTHHTGFAVVGTYERAEAERLAEVAMQLARERGFPLRVSVEKTGTTRPAGLIARWLQRARNTSVTLDLPPPPATASSDPSWADFNEPLACPECSAAGTRYRKVADALVCLACARSFAP